MAFANLSLPKLEVSPDTQFFDLPGCQPCSEPLFGDEWSSLFEGSPETQKSTPAVIDKPIFFPGTTGSHKTRRATGDEEPQLLSSIAPFQPGPLILSPSGKNQTPELARAVAPNTDCFKDLGSPEDQNREEQTLHQIPILPLVPLSAPQTAPVECPSKATKKAEAVTKALVQAMT